MLSKIGRDDRLISVEELYYDTVNPANEMRKAMDELLDIHDVYEDRNLMACIDHLNTAISELNTLQQSIFEMAYYRS